MMIHEGIINRDKCETVVEILHNHFKENMSIANVDYPKDIIFKSDDYFIYMFYSCLLDYGMKSKVYHKNLIDAYERYPLIFNPHYVIETDEASLKSILVASVHPRYPNIAARKWIKLSQSLIQYENITKYLESINSFEELVAFIKQIGGYGQKTGGLLARIISDSHICNFDCKVESIPIDRHDIEISFLTGISLYRCSKEEDIKKLSDIFVKVCNDIGVNPGDIDKYLWEIGNSFCNRKSCDDCPLTSICRKI